MKKEIKIGDSQRITISDSGIFVVPDEVKMSICEIADLFGIFYQTTKRNIRTIEKSGVANGDYSMSCIVEGQKVYPKYYGLEMIIAVSFWVQSAKADVFRKWVIRKIVRTDLPQTILLHLKNTIWN